MQMFIRPRLSVMVYWRVGAVSLIQVSYIWDKKLLFQWTFHLLGECWGEYFTQVTDAAYVLL